MKREITPKTLKLEFIPTNAGTGEVCWNFGDDERWEHSIGHAVTSWFFLNRTALDAKLSFSLAIAVTFSNGATHSGTTAVDSDIHSMTLSQWISEEIHMWLDSFEKHQQEKTAESSTR